MTVAVEKSTDVIKHI